MTGDKGVRYRDGYPDAVDKNTKYGRHCSDKEQRKRQEAGPTQASPKEAIAGCGRGEQFI